VDQWQRPDDLVAAMTAAAAFAGRPEMTLRRWVVWTSVIVGAGLGLGLALHSIATAPPTVARAPLGASVLFVAALAGELWPLPLPDETSMSLAAIAIVCAAVMYGAAIAAVIAGASMLVEELHVGRHPVKLAFNVGNCVLLGGAAGLAAHAVPGVGVIGAVLLAGAASLAVNVALIGMMVSHVHVREAANLARRRLRLPMLLPLVLSLSAAPVFIIAWQSRPAVAVVAVAPLVAVALQRRAAESERQATLLSLTDPLTGLGNRRALTSRLARELDRADQTGVPVSVCMLDLDGFKAINDSYGHQAGDRALALVGEVLRRDGEAFRYGGDEFVLVLPGRNREEAAAVGAAVRARVRALVADTMPLSVTIGIATYPDGDVSRAEVLRVADDALYAHKRISG
jgi:diguanylate cyclase (GGDEF)-like protein